MGWPQWIIALLLALDVVASGILHGAPRAPVRFEEKAAEIAILVLLLHAGGFWR